MVTGPSEKHASIVVGLGFGDEGKGFTTDFLCKGRESSIIIRYNGGHQAGHTVVTKEGKRHVFSCFGSGTLRMVPSYWSKYCTFSPTMLIIEYNELLQKKIIPKLLLDLNCPVTTHYDILYNRVLELTRKTERHGSCGLGFGATIERHQLSEIQLYVRDLFEDTILQKKLKLIRDYYKKKIDKETEYKFDVFNHNIEDENFNKCINTIKELAETKIIEIVEEEYVLGANSQWSEFIFEGAQGILLDMDFGQFPYVTRSNTSSKNAIELLKKYCYNEIDINIYYVTRCYHTRHGSGTFHDEYSVILKNTENETNIYNDYQGNFRTAILNVDLLNYAIKCDTIFSNGFTKNLVVTCLDQIDANNIMYLKGNIIQQTDYLSITNLLDYEINSFYCSFNECGDFLRKIK